MRVSLVGTGSLVPSARRSTPALCLQGGGGQVTLDGGTGTLRRQAELGIDFRKTDVLFFTHVHPDHTLDLLHFLFASKYTPGFRRTSPVRIVGPPGFSRFLDHLRDGVASWTDGGDAEIVVEELDEERPIFLGPWRVTSRKLAHQVVNYGLRFTAGSGGSVVFTGDTAWCDPLVDLCRDADLLIAECSGDAAHPAEGHLTAPEAGRLAATAGVRQLALTHLYPLSDDRARVREAAVHYPGPILLAEDGDRFLV